MPITVALVASTLLAAPAVADPVVVTPDDAVQARPGRDYTRLTTLRSLDDTIVGPITASGKVVLQRWNGHRYRMTLLDPETGRSTGLPAPRKGATIAAITADTIWYLDSTRWKDPTTILRYDRETHRTRAFRLPEEREREHTYVMEFDGDTIWYGSARPREDNVHWNVWSVRFGRAATMTPQGRHKGNPTYADGVLAWTERGDSGQPGNVVLKDVATGEATRTQMPDGCSDGNERISSNGTQFVAVLSCDRPEQKAVVVERSGEITTILEVVTEEGAYGISDRGVFFYGRFFDFATGRLLDVSDVRLENFNTAGGPGERPVQVWPQENGNALVVRLK